MKNIEERLEHHRRLELAGIKKPPLDFGFAVILWIRTRAGAETWEILPEQIADLVVSDLHNDDTAERAAIYHRIPKNAPLDVAYRWLKARTGKLW